MKITRTRSGREVLAELLAARRIHPRDGIVEASRERPSVFRRYCYERFGPDGKLYIIAANVLELLYSVAPEGLSDAEIREALIGRTSTACDLLHQLGAIRYEPFKRKRWAFKRWYVVPEPTALAPAWASSAQA